MALRRTHRCGFSKTRWRGAIRVSTMELLHSILRRVRQRAFVVLDPHEIARVDKAAANLTSEIMLSLTDAPPISALADAGRASRFVIGMIAVGANS